VNRFLLDTNVLSELRKGNRAHASVRSWFRDQPPGNKFISVLSLGEIRGGIEKIRRRDQKSAVALEKWLMRIVGQYADRILSVDEFVADRWGRFDPREPVAAIDGLLAATALVHDLVLVTRNENHVVRTGVRWCNPFTGAGSHAPQSGQ
jgi:predicted nucleic acid-binding protein